MSIRTVEKLVKLSSTTDAAYQYNVESQQTCDLKLAGP